MIWLSRILHPLPFAPLDLNDAVELRFGVALALLEGVGEHRLAEVGIGVGVVGAAGGGGEAELHGGGEVLEDAAPAGFVVGAAAVALIDHDEVEKVRRVLTEPGRGFAIGRRPAHEGLEDGGGHAALPAQGIRFQASQGVVFKGGETGEVVEGLIGEGVAIGEKENARAAVGLAREIPAGLEQLPEDLEGNGGFAGAGGEGEQDAVTS